MLVVFLVAFEGGFDFLELFGGEVFGGRGRELEEEEEEFVGGGDH